MVSFICDACGNTVKKNQVEKHYQTQCRNCSVLSCIDCGVDFPGDSYSAHTSCITEAEKYQGHLYQPKNKENKGEAKQKEWVKQIQNVGGHVKDPRIKSLLSRIAEYSNIPRKKKKFENFCKNSVNVYDQKTLDALWDAFNTSLTQPKSAKTVNNEENSKDKTNSTDTSEDCDNNDDKKTKVKKTKKRKLKENSEDEIQENGEVRISKKKKKKKKQDTENEETEEVEEITGDEEKKGKFNWHKTIKSVLKLSDDRQLPVKKLRKKVLAAYQEHGVDHRTNTVEECRALFEKKLNSYPKVKVKKEGWTRL